MRPCEDGLPVQIVKDEGCQSLSLASVLDQAGYEVVGPASDHENAKTSVHVLNTLIDWQVPTLIVMSHDRIGFRRR